jgi:hypothetical protein
MKNRSRNKTVSEEKNLEKLFPEQWRENIRKTLAETKSGDERWGTKMLGLFETAIIYRVRADIALEYAPKKLFWRIVVDAEGVCNDLGISLIRDGDTISTCMTKTHADCTGSYVNTHPRVKRTIFCRCKCHLPNAKM